MSYNQYPAPIQQATYPIEQQQVPTQMNVHPSTQNPPLQLLPAQNPTRPAQLPVQPVANPNNKTVHDAYNVDLQTYPTFPTYLISTVPFQGVQLRSGKDLSQNNPPVTIEEEPELNPNPNIVDDAANEDNVVVLTKQIQKG